MRRVGSAPIFPWREVVVAVVAAVAVNVLWRALLVALTDLNATPAPLGYQAIIFWTVILVVVAGVVWHVVRGRSQTPRRTYRLIAGAVLLLSLVPDLLLDISWGGRLSLMGMHVLTAAICVACYTGSPSANARGSREWRAPQRR